MSTEENIDKFINIIQIAFTGMAIIIVLIYLILNHPAVDPGDNPEYDPEHKTITSEFNDTPGSEFSLVASATGKELNKIILSPEYDEGNKATNQNSENKEEEKSEVNAWNEVFSLTLDYIYEHMTGTLIGTEALYLTDLHPNYDVATLFKTDSNNNKLSPGSKPKICYYISYPGPSDALETEPIYVGSYIMKIWIDNGFDYNIEFLVSYSKNPDQIIKIYQNGKLLSN